MLFTSSSMGPSASFSTSPWLLEEMSLFCTSSSGDRRAAFSVQRRRTCIKNLIIQTKTLCDVFVKYLALTEVMGGCVCVYIQGFCRFQQVEFKIFYDIFSLWMHLKNYELFILNVIYGMCGFLQLIFEFRCNSNAFIPSLAYIYIFQYIGYLYKYAVLIIHPWCVCVHVHFLTLLTPFHLLDLVHSALEDVALVRLDTETGNVTHVGWQQLSQLLDVAALQLPSPLLQTAGKNKNKTDV